MARVLWITVAMMGATGCVTQECNLMYAPDTISVALHADAWADGAWRVEIDGVGCDVTLPDGADLVCDAVEEQPSLTLDGAGLGTLTLWNYVPPTVEVVVLHDGVEVVREELTPEYAEDEPNGEGCGERRYATVDVDVPAV
jgi:hypothetical protein